MFGAVAACRDKHRLQPCEPKPRPAEARKHSPRWLRHENTSRTSVKTDKTSCQTTANEQRISFNPPAPLRRQRTAESTCTTLVQAVACTTPGVKLPKAKIIKTERTPTGEHLRLKSCRQAKTPYDRPSPSPAKSAARGIDKSSNLPFRGTFYTIGSSISVILITQMDFLIINSVQNLRGGDFLYLCIVRTARWTFGHWDEDATHILRGTARPPVGRCFS